MSTPRSIRTLVTEWRSKAEDVDATYLERQGIAYAAELEQLCDEWEAQILAGIEQRKIQQSPGPLYSLGTNQAANDILEHIFGAKTP